LSKRIFEVAIRRRSSIANGARCFGNLVDIMKIMRVCPKEGGAPAGSTFSFCGTAAGAGGTTGLMSAVWGARRRSDAKISTSRESISDPTHSAVAYAAIRPLAGNPVTAMGMHETEANIVKKIRRGGFTAVFFVQCLLAVGCHAVRLVDSE